jgi:hypothetical protein
MGREQSLRLNIAVSGGAGIGTITKVWDLARWVRIAPINETDTYTLTIKDSDGMIMGLWTGQLGTFSSRLEISLGIMATVEISAASTDGTYVCKFDMH